MVSLIRLVGVRVIAFHGGWLGGESPSPCVPRVVAFTLSILRRLGEDTGDLGRLIGAHHGVHSITLLVARIGPGEHPLTEPGDVGDARTRSSLNIDQCVPGPLLMKRQFGENQTPRCLPVVAPDRLLRQDTAQHLVG